MKKDSIPIRKANVEERFSDDEAFVLSLEKGVFYKFNNVATDIWKIIDGKVRVSEITRILCERYDVKKADLERDINEFIRQGVKDGVIELAE